MRQEGKQSVIGKTGSILLPLAVYYAVYMVSLVILTYCLQSVGAEAVREASLTGIVNGVSMLAGALVLLPALRMELQGHRNGVRRHNGHADRPNERQAMWKAAAILVTVVLAASSSVGLNILLSLTGLVQNSSAYQDVAQRQYDVTFGVGLFLYTVVSPLAEEIVFRGVVYNRMRRYFQDAAGTGEGTVRSQDAARAGKDGVQRWKAAGAGEAAGQRSDTAGTGATQGADPAAVAAILASGVLFGIYHGNLVQGIYGCCMGILMAYLYERSHTFRIPVLFHGAANCVVYLMAQNAALQEKLFTVPCCAALFVVAAIMLIIVKKSDILQAMHRGVK